MVLVSKKIHNIFGGFVGKKMLFCEDEGALTTSLKLFVLELLFIIHLMKLSLPELKSWLYNSL